MPHPAPTRRSFLVSAGTAAAATVAGSVATGFPANETVNVGVVGSGGRARTLMKSFPQLEKVRVVTVCDVWAAALGEAKKLAGPQATTTKHYPDVFVDKAVHAVLIGAPDHWHVPLTVAAVAAGKDVYVEKPLTHTLSEGRAVIDAVAKAKRVVQVGTQQRSMPHIIKARDMVQAGAIGQVVKVTMSWNRNANRVNRFPLGVDPKAVDWKAFLGNAPDQPFDEYRMRNWRWFWDFGGGIFTDLMVHWVDVAHFVLGLDAPEKAVSAGEFVSAKGVWETPDSVQTLMSYPGGVQMHFEGTFSNARYGARIEFMGTEATLYADRGRIELIPERGKKVPPLLEVLGKTPAHAGRGLLRPAGRRVAAPAELAGLRAEPAGAGGPGGGGRRGGGRRAPGEPVATDGPDGRGEGVSRSVRGRRGVVGRRGGRRRHIGQGRGRLGERVTAVARDEGLRRRDVLEVRRLAEVGRTICYPARTRRRRTVPSFALHNWLRWMVIYSSAYSRPVRSFVSRKTYNLGPGYRTFDTFQLQSNTGTASGNAISAG